MLDTVLIPRARTTLGLDRGPAPPPAARGLGLTLPDLEELLLAVGDREDTVGTDARARLARGRIALEAELTRLLAE